MQIEGDICGKVIHTEHYTDRKASPFAARDRRIVSETVEAALHSYAMSQRFLLKGAGVRVLEIAPPWVRTDLMNSREAEEAMPLDQFIAETLAVLGTDADEIVVEGAKGFRSNVGPNEHSLVDSFNEFASARFAGG